MKALVYRRYGTPDVLGIETVEKPVAQENQVLVKVRATTVNRTDSATIQAIPFFARLATGLFRPRKQIPGTEFAGDVERVGSAVRSIKVGDRVFGFDEMGTGAHAEYLVVPENRVTTIPEAIDYDVAAATMEGLHYALNGLNKITLGQDHSAMVYGASGAIGSAAVQLLKHFGSDVTAVCSTRNLQAVSRLGADRLVDYCKEDFTQDKRKYDLVFDAVGKRSFFQCYRLLNAGGTYISTDLGFMAQNIYLPLLTSIFRHLLGGRKSVFPFPVDIPASLRLAKDLLDTGAFRPLIDRTYALDDIVEAYRYVGTGRKTGVVVVTL